MTIKELKKIVDEIAAKNENAPVEIETPDGPFKNYWTVSRVRLYTEEDDEKENTVYIECKEYY